MWKGEPGSLEIRYASLGRSMSAWFFTALIYLFGFVGLASIGILPLRAWKALRSAFEGSLAPTARTTSLVFIALMAAVALWADMQITIRIFKCLTESYCGPGVASGWTYLATLGAVCIASAGTAGFSEDPGVLMHSEAASFLVDCGRQGWKGGDGKFI